MGSFGRGDLSKTASIYKNPFEVEKDQLIRQLFEFPARIAAFVKSQKNDGDESSEVIESPFVLLAAKSKVRDEMEARHLVSSEKVCGLLMSGANETLVEHLPLRNLSSEDADGGRSATVQETSERALETTKVVTSGLITYSRRKRKFVDKSGASGEARLAATTKEVVVQVDQPGASGEARSAAKIKEVVAPVNQPGASGEARSAATQEVVAPSVPAPTSTLKPHDVAGFIIQMIRTLRHTRHGDTEKLFELLSVQDFPVDKCRFVEELIRQAQHYNKDVVAKQLAQYRSQMG